MSLTPEQCRIAVSLLIEKSDRNMEQAKANASLEYWDLVANRLYYSVFHAVTALMQTDGMKMGTHKGTSSQFGQHYILTGIFERKDGILYSRLQTMREKADYQNTFTLTPEEGIKLIEATEDLRIRVIAHVKNKIL